ncbi:tetratricopeptide repeat protein [Blautia sp.]|uniref:tetratricopeptide repeat protein n=1 Tax=Blautia sp. TaxID=1955243 RepID=UPI002590C7CB|nr:tetratricopeptide repeat protein [Blautia sp.]
MDKNEYRAKLDVINDLVDRQDYKGALEIVDTIDWRRVRSARTLCMVGEIYEANKRYEDSRKLLILAHQRAPIGKTVIYRLVELAIKMGNFDEAIDYFNQFVEISPNDNSRYILKYKIYRGRRSPIQEQIAILEEYKGREYTERWSYELARLYAKAGMKDKCVEECDDLILWFSEGKYVIKAMELKMKYAPLSLSQEEKYRNRLVESSPEKAAAAAAATITAATQAASKLVSQSVGTGVLEQNTDEMPHIESVRSRATGKAPEEVSVFSPILETTGVLQDKIAKGIRDVFSGGPREEEPETETEETADSAAEDTEGYSIQDDTKDYVVKDLEPDNPAYLGSVTPAAKESPVSRTVEAPKPKAVKAQEPVREVDLDAILAETAGELAQAVAKVSEGVAPAGAAVADTHSFTAQNADVTPVTEAEKAEEPASQIEAAESEKAEEPVYQTDAAASEKLEEPVYQAAAAEKAEEPVYQTVAAAPEKVEEPAYQAEAAESEKAEDAVYQTEAAEPEKTEEPIYQTEAAESEKTEEPAYQTEADTQEETVFAEEEIPGQPSMADIMAEAAVTSEADIPDGRTIEIPVEEVRAGLGGMTIDLQKALESAVMEPESPAQTEDMVQSGNVVQSDAMMQSGASVQPEDSENEFIHTVAEDKRMPAEASMSPAGIATESILRHHLTPEEQKRLFTYFAPIPGLTQQITEALDIAQESACAKTSKSGNIVITGREGAGKTRLSEGLIKAICKERHMEGAKIAYLDAQKMNEKDPAYVVDKLAGGFLVVENASSLQSDVIEKLSKAMEFRTNRLTVILEDLKPGIQNLEKMYPEFMEKFDSRVVIPVFTNDELVSFAKTYSKEMGYKIDDMAVLALYTLIGDNQDEDDPVSVGQVKEMMDSAIKRASRGGRRPGKKVAKRHLDESGRIMLYEKDFDV